MADIAKDLSALLPGLTKCVFSQPVSKESPVKLAVHPVRLKTGIVYQLERFSGTKVFHVNLSADELLTLVRSELCGSYRQVLIVSGSSSRQYVLKNDGSYKCTARAAVAAPARTVEDHNRQKQYILNEGDRIPALVDLGVFTPDYKIVKARYDKYKQINRFIELVADEFTGYDKKEISILDFGCGKSYLTFILYYYFTEKLGLNANIIGYDLKEDVVENCNAIAAKYGYDRLRFVKADVTRDVLYDKHIDMVVSLHACDTATDYALFYAIEKGVKHIFSVPCCQHEINNSIGKGGELDIFLRHGIVKERMSALLTDSFRAAILEDFGYSVDMIEFIDFDNSPKNILLRCTKKRGFRSNNLPALRSTAKQYNFEQTLLKLCETAIGQENRI